MSETVPTIERAYRMRVYPNRVQARHLAQLAGAARFVWNWALARRSTAYRADGTRINWVALSRELTQLRAAPDTAWLGALPQHRRSANREPIARRARAPNRPKRRFGTGGEDGT